jgi:hypothetical protein
MVSHFSFVATTRGVSAPRAFLLAGIWLLGMVVGITAVSSIPSTAAAAVATPAPGVITHTVYFPLTSRPPSPEPLPPPIPFSGEAPIDFTAVSADLRAQGLALAFNKIGFHAGPGGNPTGLNDYLARLDAAGVPFVVKSTDTLTGVYEGQGLMRRSGLPHVLIFRRSIVPPGAAPPPSGNPDVPDYDKPPALAAAEHWAWHKQHFPPELDPELTWVETVNEVDKNRSEWLAEFALETARLALADGYKWAAFGWSSGEPEPEHWTSPAMLDFLRLAAAKPDRLAIALHEYSFTTQAIGNWYPYLLGRFQALFQACDQHYIERPTILITEWGWEPVHVPSPEAAMEDVAWAAWLYAAYPQVKGAALWYLGPGFAGIADEAQLLVEPMATYSVSHYFGATPGQGAIDAGLFAPSPPTQLVWPEGMER